MKSQISNGSGSPPATSAADTSDLGPIDFAAERKAAEWVLARKGGVELADEQGRSVKLVKGQPPLTPFVVKVVHLSNMPDLIDDELANLAGCRRLEWIGLSSSPQITFRGLDSLRGVRSLRQLEVGNTSVDDEVIARLSIWPQLEKLDVCDCQSISDTGLEQLPAETRLKRFRIKSPRITDDGLRTIAERCPHLELIACANFTRDQNLTLLPLAKLRLLQEVQCSGYQLTDDGVSILLDLPQLERLYVISPTDDARIGQLVKLQDKLHALTVHSNDPNESGLTPAGYDSIRQLHQLTELWVIGYAGAPTDAVLRSLTELPNLRTLKLQFADEKRRYTPEGINAFRELRPDVNVVLVAEGQDYPATKLASEVVIPKRTQAPAAIPVEADKPAAGTAKTAIAKSRPSVPLAVKVPRVEIPAMPLPTKPNKAISNRATVSLPATIPGLRGWSIEVGGHTGIITSLAYSPDGQSIASVGESDDTVRIWKISEVANTPVLMLDRVLFGEEGNIRDVAWSPDGFTLATTSHVGRSVTLFDVPTGRLLKRLALANGNGWSVAWSPDGRLISTAHYFHMGLIDPIRGVVRLSQKTGPFSSGCWSPDGSQIASVDGVGGIKFWKPQTLEPNVEFDSGERGLLNVEWSPDGKWIATGGNEGVVKIWEAATKKRVQELRNEIGAILGLSWEPATAGTSPAKHAAWPRLAAVGSNQKLTVWDPTKGDKLLDTMIAAQSITVRWSPDGTQIAIAPFNDLELRDSATGKRISTTENFGNPVISQITANNLSASGKELRVQHATELTVWDADAGSFVKRVENLPSGQSLASPTDEWLAMFDDQSPQGNLHLVDTATYQNHRPLLGHGGTITAVNWSNDGKTLASSSKDQTVRLWNAATGEQLLSIPHPTAVRSVVWSTDGKRLATCGNDDIIRLWLSATGKAAGEFPRLPAACWPGPSGLAWSRDEKYLAIAGYDGAIRVLDLKSGKVSDPLLQFNTASVSVAWSGDSKQILASSNGAAGYRTLTAREGTTVYGYGSPVQWLPDNRRFLTGLFGYFPLQGLDAKRNAKIGTLYPNIVGGHHVCISADGHYRGSPGIEQHIVYVALTKEGHQQTYSPADFAAKFNWKNDPTKARLLQADK